MAEMDRALRGSRNHFNSKILVFLITSVIVVSLITSMLTASPPASNVPAHISYATHTPISINGNAGFLGPNATTGISWGNGTVGNPYIIEGWDIDASTNHGIAIFNADVHFLIRDCYLHGGGASYHGAALSGCKNGTLLNVSCSNNLIGILLGNSRNTILENCTCSNNWIGIYLASSICCTLTRNTLIDDGIFIEKENILHWNTHNIDSSNTVNGRPVYYFKNQSGTGIPAGAGQVILANCSSMVVQNQNLSQGSVGIEVGFCSGITIENNNCSDGLIGIFLYSSDGNQVNHNNCSHNTNEGMAFWTSSDNNTITHNNC